jgi:hypothetical protein
VTIIKGSRHEHDGRRARGPRLLERGCAAVTSQPTTYDYDGIGGGKAGDGARGSCARAAGVAVTPARGSGSAAWPTRGRAPGGVPGGPARSARARSLPREWGAVARAAPHGDVSSPPFLRRLRYAMLIVCHQLLSPVTHGYIWIWIRPFCSHWIPSMALFDTPGLELELVSNSSSSPELTLALEVFGMKG